MNRLYKRTLTFKDGDLMKTSIVILTKDNLKYTKLCLESIRKYTKERTYELIIVDNGSQDGTVDYIKGLKGIKFILNESNRGFPQGCNQGIQIANKENDILLLNNDVIVTNNWLLNLNKCLYSSKDIGAVGAVTNSCSYLQTINASYKNLNELQDFAKVNNISDSNRWEERLKLVGFCMLIKREVLDKIGLLDQRFTPGNFEDDDYSLRIIREGYRLMLCKDCYIHHFCSVSFNKNLSFLSNSMLINREKFYKKWGVASDEIFGFNRDTPIFLNENSLDKFSFLHVNCGGGGSLLYLKTIFKNIEVYGIENDINLIKTLAPCGWNNDRGIGKSITIYTYDEIYNMERKNLFDYIYIEVKNLYNFEKDFINAVKLIKKQGTFIINRDIFKLKEEYIKATLTKEFNNYSLIELYNKILINLIDKKEKVKVRYLNYNKCKTTDSNINIDKNKIAFICCINNRNKFKEAKNYINRLNDYANVSCEILAVENAPSLTSGYNVAMNNTNAKYKVYIHQDVYILNKYFIRDIINIFNKDENLGVLGCTGCEKLPKNAIWWEGKCYGKVFDNHNNNMSYLKFNDFGGLYKEVEALDGLILITSKDITWREDVFNGWHFYDISQCKEFYRKGYKVAVINQFNPWFIHNCGIVSLDGYEEYRLKFIKEYEKEEII